MKRVKEFPYLVISWDNESRSVVMQWRGGFKHRKLKEGMFAGLEELKTRSPGAQWINDTTDIGVIGMDEQAWIDQEWFPLFLATGVTHVAMVQPKSAIANLSVKHSMEESNKKMEDVHLNVHICTILDEARQWMREQIS